MLVEEIADRLSPLLVLLAGGGLLLQALILLQSERFTALWRDSRGHLLVVSLLLTLGYGAAERWLPGAVRLQLFCFLLLALCGALLVLQPVPDGEAGRARRARH